MPSTLDRPFTSGEIEYFGTYPDGLRLGLLKQRVEIGSAAASQALSKNLPSGARVIRSAMSLVTAVTLVTGTHIGLGTADNPTQFAMSGTTMTAGTRAANQPGPGVVYSYANNAASAALTASDTETAFDKKGTLPANFLKPGDIIRVRFQGIATATNSTDTLLCKVLIGGTTVHVQAAVDVANNDAFQGDVCVVVRSIGATGAVVASNLAPVIGSAKQDGSSAVTVRSEFLASTAIDTTVANDVKVHGKWSTTNAGNSCRLDLIQVEVIRPGSLELPAEVTPTVYSVSSAGAAAGTVAGTIDCFIWFWETRPTLPIPSA